ncbi:hypothetical protein [Streptomyces erythrochromogenes]|uniref:hypothetical protein n=1 Tax=Streptomyces erythrochromogenes TaxID=285574 RepID=UPI0033DE81FA
MKNPHAGEGSRGSPVLHMPQQAPPVDRSSGRAAGTAVGSSGVEPSFFPWLDDLTPFPKPLPLPLPLPWMNGTG